MNLDLKKRHFFSQYRSAQYRKVYRYLVKTGLLLWILHLFLRNPLQTCIKPSPTSAKSTWLRVQV